MREPTAVSDPRIGSVLQERYRIIERLAAGGMGIVYRGERLEVGKAVAIKFLHAWAARDEDFRKRFQVEARAMSRLTHPCCVSVMDFGVDQDSPLYATGVLLFELLTGKKPFNAQGTAELLRMHREAKPPLLREAAPEAGFSAEFEATVAKALAKAPGDRFQSAAEFLTALETTRPTAFLAAPSAHDEAPGAPGPASSTPARPVEEALATENALAPTRELRMRTPAQAPAPTPVAPVEAEVAPGPASSRNEVTVRVPAARPAASEATLRSGPFARFRSRAVVGGAAGLVLLGAGLVGWAVSSTSADLALDSEGWGGTGEPSRALRARQCLAARSGAAPGHRRGPPVD